MSYTIKLEQGKYLIINDNGSLTILRNGEPWPAAEELKHVKLVGALAARIEELEMAIGAVVNGTLNERGVRRGDGTGNFTQCFAPTEKWDTALRKVLDQ